jgi:cell division protein FtsB
MQNFLNESRVDDFRVKYSKNFSQEQLQRIINLISPKFLNWVGKNLDKINFDAYLQTTNDYLKKFEKFSTNLPKTDLYQYQSLTELVEELNKYEDRQRRSSQKVKGGNLVFEDDRFYVVNPLTHDASCYYGKGTKWCTAASTDTHFKKYNEESKLFYVVDKKLATDDPFYKVAILKNFDGGEQFWDAQDKQFQKGWILGTEEFEDIKKSITTYMSNNYAEQIKIFTDKELARKERDRLEKLRIQRERRQKEAQAEERRIDNEWELNYDCPEVGLEAHALLKYLVEYEGVEELTEDDKMRMSAIKDEIEELQRQYDESEDPNIDILDQIEVLEEELESFDNRIDVYNIIPAGTHYDMTTFEVLNDELIHREYMSGDEYDTKTSAFEAVDGLLDDIGYEGFNKSFVESHIDGDEVEEYAKDFYYDDIHENPESYFDDSDRELSGRQQEEIKIKNEKILSFKQKISSLESKLLDIEDEDEVSDLEQTIEELEDEVTNLEDEIEEIEGEPDGDFPDEMIEDAARERARDAGYDPMSFINEMGLDYTNFINKRDFIDDVVESDGYGSAIGTYDGSLDEYSVLGNTYYVGRYN